MINKRENPAKPTPKNKGQSIPKESQPTTKKVAGHGTLQTWH
jgi:hypothetical protein